MATHTTSMATSITSTATSTAATPTNTSNTTMTSQKPLLFFVALGFGVVFTNLWIIVGVKYCFRYNRRARPALTDNGNNDTIGLGNIPRTRRRREKKLMSMEEVNERFPLTKYKLWRATREQEGLPPEGGITAPPSRAASIKDVFLERSSTEQEGCFTVSEQKEITGTSHRNDAGVGNEKSKSEPLRESSDTAPQHVDGSSDLPTGGNGLAAKEISVATPAAKTDKPKPEPSSEQVDEKAEKLEKNVVEVAATPVDEDEDDPISTALPAEMIAQPGDSCAICLDTLDDDDDVRGLTCGHAFHAGCLDPWLTSRRACCPLCKADYYVPKPRADADGTGNGEGSRDPNGLAAPRPVFIGGRTATTFRPRMIVSGTRYQSDTRDRYGFPVWRPMESRRNNNRRATEVSMVTTASEGGEDEAERRSFRERYMDAIRRVPRGAAAASHFRSMSRRQSENTTDNSQSRNTSNTTPGQLEAGIRPQS